MNRIIEGITYIQFEELRMRVWGKDDLHVGAGTGTFIGAEGDLVFDNTTQTQYLVIDVDSTTGISKLQELTASPCSPVLLMYVDTNTTPTSVTVDSTFSLLGDAGYVIMYKGVVAQGNSISEVYDHGGAFDTNRVPVRRVNSDSHEPHSVYNVDRWHTGETLVNGDSVTAVAYDIYDNIMSVRTFTVMDASALNDAAPILRTIRSVDLMTPFMDDGDVIRRPITITTADLNFVVKVTYMDGSEELIGLDHDRVELAGLDIVSLNNTALDHDIMLIYRTMGDPVNGPLDSNGIITTHYHLRNYVPAKSYSHSIQVYPRYINQAEGYRMEAWLTLADRSMIMEVSQYVEYDPPLNGTDLSTIQEIEAKLDLKYLHAIPESHNVTKRVWVSLLNTGGAVEPAWDMHGHSSYIKAYSVMTVVGTASLVITNSPDDWWDEAYLSTEPMMLSGIEVDPPVPTHIVVHDTLNGDIVLHKSEINSIIPFPELIPNDVIHVTFIQLLGDAQIKLAHLPIFI